MISRTRLAAFAFVAGLMAASVALAQTQTAAQPAPPAQPPPPSAALPSGTLPPAQPDASTLKPGYTEDNRQPTYGVDPPPDTPSGVYLPAAVLGYAKSAAGCVTIGCDDGPHAGGAAGPASAGSPAPQPSAPAPSDPEPSAPH
ncbi:MAG: hypothetical protein WDM85_18910 [Caulobacteraceae bacterium]